MQSIPDEIIAKLKHLPEPERNELLRAGVYEAAHARVSKLQAEIVQCEERIRHFETQYGVSFDQFEAEVLPTLDSLQAHEDYNDWFYWEQVLAEKKALLAELNRIELT